MVFFLSHVFNCFLYDTTPNCTRSIWLSKQVAFGEAYARSGVIYRVFRGVGAERFDHEHVLAVFARIAASLRGAQRSDRQRARRSLLPVPLLLSVSIKSGGGMRAGI